MQGAACVDIIALTQHYCVPLRRLLRHQPAPAAPVHDAGGHLPWAGQVRTLQPGKKMGGHAGTCVCVYAGQCRVKHHTPNLAHTFGSLMKIYGTFLMGHLSRFKEDVQVRSVACKLAIAATLDHAKLHIIRHQLVAGCACACATPAAPQSCRRWAQILQAGLALHEKVSASFRKTAVNFHYEFTVRAAAHTPCGPNN